MKIFDFFEKINEFFSKLLVALIGAPFFEKFTIPPLLSDPL